MDEIRWKLLVRVLSSEASPEEEAELRRWEAADRANAELLDALRRLWQASGELPEPGGEQRAWQRVAEGARLRDSEPERVHPIRRPLASPRVPTSPWRALRGGALLRAAAAVLLVAGAAALWQLSGGPAWERTVVTGKGERVHLVLSDGSQVLLGPDSRLRYPRRFGAERRDVQLTGAAYFEVAHDPRRPFSVRTPDALTRVLGTRFAVRDYAGDEPARVVVTEGRVAVRPVAEGRSGPARTAILTRGQALDLPAPGLPATLDSLDRQQDLGWTRGVLSFKNAPVPQVLTELGRWYDVEISAPDPSLASRHLTIAFNHEALEVILQEIALALGARVERDGRRIRLVPDLSARPAATNHPVHASIP